MCDNSHCNSNTNQLLIDFNSPLQTQLKAVNSGHLMPLVPSPLSLAGSSSITSACNQTILDGDNDSDVDDNPFDLVLHQTNLNIRMLNDPFELVYQKAYNLPTDASYEGNNKSTDPQLTNTSVKGASTTPMPICTVPSMQDIGSTTLNNCEGYSVHSNGMAQTLEHLNEGEFGVENSLICIEDITDPSGCMFLSLSDTSHTSKQSSATERRTVSNDLNITNTINVHQIVKNSSKLYNAKSVEKKANIDESNLFSHVRCSCYNGHNEEQNCFSVVCTDKKAETDVFLPSQENTINTGFNTDEELKAIVANRISACIKHALGKLKLSTKENDICDHSSASHVTAATPDKNVVPHTYLSHKDSHSLLLASPAIKKTGLSPAVNGDVDVSVEALQVVCQQGNVNSVNTGLVTCLNTSLDRLKIPAPRESSSSSTVSVISYGELNKAFCTIVSSNSTTNTPPDQSCDNLSSDFRVTINNGSVKFPSISGSVEKVSSLKCVNSLDVKKNGALNNFGNKSCCSIPIGHKNVTANGGNIETIIKINGVCDEQTMHLTGKDMLQRKNEYTNLVHENSLDTDKNTSTCSPSNIDDYVAGNIDVRRSLASSWCMGSSNSKKNEELDRDDSLFLEANTLAFVFSKVADSFTQLTSSDGEEDILTCKPQWEVSQLHLPKFSAEEDDAEPAQKNGLQTGTETKKDGKERSQKTGFPLNDDTSPGRHKNSLHQKEFDAKEKSGCSSTSSESSVTSCSSKQSSGSCSNSSTPPLSKQRIQGLGLHTRHVSSVDKKLSRAVPNAVILPSLNLMDDSAEKGARLKPKRKQEVGKRGPMKAVVPVDNMTRTNGAEKKGVNAGAHAPKAKSTAMVSSTPKPVVRSLLNHETEANNSTSIMSTISTQKKTVSPGAVSVLESRTVAVKKDSSGISRSFTGLSSLSSVPVVRHSNSLTSGIPSLVSPSVTLLNQPPSCANNDLPVNSKENSKPLLNMQPETPVRKQPSCQIPTVGSQEKSNKSASSIPQFNLSGSAVTSTPTRKDRYTSPNHSTLRSLPSPIPVRDIREKPALQTGASESVKPVVRSRNRSIDSFQQIEKTKPILKHHGRSKSVSSTQLQREKQTLLLTENHSDKSKIRISSAKSTPFGNGARKGHSKSPYFQMGVSKPLVMKNLNNQYAASKESPKVNLSSSVSGNDQKRAKPSLQLCSKLKRSAVVPMDKENVNPSCEIHL